MKETFGFLKEKAKKFYDEAIYDCSKENYDLAAFHLEQSVQLYLKFTIGIFAGDFPRTHDLKRLLEGLCEISNNNSLLTLKATRKRVIKKLEDSYFEARYFGTPFEKEDVEEMLHFTDELLNIISVLWT